jgi:hypothetical protein
MGKKISVGKNGGIERHEQEEADSDTERNG